MFVCVAAKYVGIADPLLYWLFMNDDNHHGGNTSCYWQNTHIPLIAKSILRHLWWVQQDSLSIPCCLRVHFRCCSLTNKVWCTPSTSLQNNWWVLCTVPVPIRVTILTRIHFFSFFRYHVHSKVVVAPVASSDSGVSCSSNELISLLLRRIRYVCICTLGHKITVVV